MKRIKITPVAMRTVFGLLLISLLGSMGAGFYFAYSQLVEVAKETAAINADVDLSDKQLSKLASIDRDLDKYSSSIKRAKLIVAESTSYQYQNQIINDLMRYASVAGVSISSFGFNDNNASESAAGATPQAGTPPPGSQTPQQTPGGPAASTTVQPKSTMVTVRLGENTPYTSLLHFIYLIEQNLTRMQLTQLSVARGDDPKNVSSQTLDIEVYIK